MTRINKKIIMKLLQIKLNKKKGISLIEIIIYIAIFSMISILVMNSFIVVLSSFSAVRVNHDLLNSGNNTMEKISREIRQAKNVDLVNSVFNSNSSILTLTAVDGISTVKFIKEGGDLNYYRNGVLVGNLLVEKVSLNAFRLTHIVTTKGEAVVIEITVQSIRGKINKTEKFYNTVVVRGSY